MNEKEAREVFGLREDETIYKPGAETILKIAEANLKEYLLGNRTKADREQFVKEYEAAKELLKGAIEWTPPNS